MSNEPSSSQTFSLPGSLLRSERLFRQRARWLAAASISERVTRLGSFCFPSRPTQTHSTSRPTRYLSFARALLAPVRQTRVICPATPQPQSSELVPSNTSKAATPNQALSLGALGH